MGGIRQSPNRRLACVDAVREEIISDSFYKATYIVFFNTRVNPSCGLLACWNCSRFSHIQFSPKISYLKCSKQLWKRPCEFLDQLGFCYFVGTLQKKFKKGKFHWIISFLTLYFRRQSDTAMHCNDYLKNSLSWCKKCAVVYLGQIVLSTICALFKKKLIYFICEMQIYLRH